MISPAELATMKAVGGFRPIPALPIQSDIARSRRRKQKLRCGEAGWPVAAPLRVVDDERPFQYGSPISGGMLANR